MASAAEARRLAPGRARVVLELLAHEGWKVTKLLTIIEPIGGEDTEVIFLGRKASMRGGGDPQGPHTALIPQTEHGDIVVLDRVL